MRTFVLLICLAAVGVLSQGPGNFTSLLVTGPATIDGNVIIEASGILPLQVSTSSTTSVGIALEQSDVIKSIWNHNSVTGVTLKNGQLGVILKQGSSGTSDVSLLSNHNVLDDGTGNMVVVGTISALGLLANTLQIDGTNIPGLIATVTSNAQTSSSGGSIAGSSFVTVNSITLPSTGLYECTFSGTYAAASNIGCQISLGTSGTVQADSNRASAVGPASWSTDAGFFVPSSALVIGECNRVAGTHTIVPGNNRLSCQRVG